jgi:hypothetical protein
MRDDNAIPSPDEQNRLIAEACGGTEAILRAHRNAIILRWLHGCAEPFRAELVARYATSLGNCPLDEIDPSFTGADDLEWLWANYSATINEFESDGQS